MLCPKCGKENTGDNRFCVQCGNDLNPSQMNNTNSNKNSQLTDMFSTSSSSNTPEQTSNTANNGNNNITNPTLGGMYNQTSNMNQPINSVNNQPNNMNNQSLGSMYNQSNNKSSNNNSNSIIKIIVALIVAVVVFFLVNSLFNTSSSKLTCSKKEKLADNLFGEEEIVFEVQKGKSGKYVTSTSTVKVYKADHSTITSEQYEAFVKANGELGFNQQSSTDGKVITITYSMSHLNISTLEEARIQITGEGYNCN